MEGVRAAAARAAPELTAALDGVGDATRACGDEIRAVTNVLRPAVLDDFGFVEALREYVAASATDAAPAVTLAVDVADARRAAARARRRRCFACCRRRS